MLHTRDLQIGDRVRFVFPQALAGREATVTERPDGYQGKNMAGVVVRLDDGMEKLANGEVFERVETPTQKAR